jgi:hypothetical protein
VAAGKTVWLRNTNGPIKVVRSSGKQVEIVGTRVTRRGPPDAIELVAVPHDGTVTVCALWPATKRSCGPRGAYRMSGGDRTDNNTYVELELRIPAGVGVDVSTVNGVIAVTGLAANAEVNTVNGAIDVGIEAGTLRVNTVNGSISATLGARAGNAALATVNGAVEATLTGGLHAELSAELVHGSIDVAGVPTPNHRPGGQRVQTTLGRGGRTLSIETVNGSVAVR